VNCEKVRTRLSAYVDGELDAGLHEEIAGHVKACPRCRKEAEEFRRVDARIKELSSYPLPGDFARAVRSRVQETLCGERSLPFAHRAWKSFLDSCQRFFDLLNPEVPAGSRSLEEFNDLPPSFIGHAYFRILR